MKKGVVLCLIVSLAVPSLIMINSASASIPKPSVPEFTLKFVAHPYDVPPKYGINPYTGKSEMTEAGYHAENKSIEVIIKNQPFTSTLDASGNYANLYYFVRFKGHYANEWGYWGYYPRNPDDNYSTAIATPVNASQSEYTTITLSLASYRFGKVPAKSEIDFQVEAFIGYEKQVEFVFLHDVGHYYVFSAFERSGWSNTQTIKIGADSSTTSPYTGSPTPSPYPSDSTTAPAAPPSPTLKPDSTIESATNETAQALSLAIIGVGIAFVLVSFGLLASSKKHADP